MNIASDQMVIAQSRLLFCSIVSKYSKFNTNHKNRIKNSQIITLQIYAKMQCECKFKQNKQEKTMILGEIEDFRSRPISQKHHRRFLSIETIEHLF